MQNMQGTVENAKNGDRRTKRSLAIKTPNYLICTLA